MAGFSGPIANKRRDFVQGQEQLQTSGSEAPEAEFQIERRRCFVFRVNGEHGAGDLARHHLRHGIEDQKMAEPLAAEAEIDGRPRSVAGFWDSAAVSWPYWRAAGRVRRSSWRACNSRKLVLLANGHEARRRSPAAVLSRLGLEIAVECVDAA